MRVPRIRANPEMARRVEGTLSASAGIDRVSVDRTTGSVLIHYDEQGYPSAAALLRVVKTLRPLLFEDSPDIEELLSGFSSEVCTIGSAQDYVSSVLRSLNDWVGDTVGADLRLLLPLSLLPLGVRAYLLAEERGAPGWYNFLWFGFSSYVMLNTPKESPAGRVAAQAVQAAQPA